MKPSRGVILFALLIAACLTTEYVSHRQVNPTGRASTLSEYLAWRPSANQFATININGKPHLIAYGPASSWLLLSSGPSACVFDDTGRLVDWSYDIGDDPKFDNRWNAQRSRGPDHSLSRNQVESLATTRPAG